MNVICKGIPHHLIFKEKREKNAFLTLDKATRSISTPRLPYQRVNKVETIFFQNAHYDSKRNASQTPIIHVT